MRTTRLLPLVLLGTTLFATACGDDGPVAAPGAGTPSSAGTPSAATSPPSPSGPSASPSTGGGTDVEHRDDAAAPPFGADRATDTSPGEGNGLSVVDVRVGAHEGYDRVVFELGGEGTAGWRVGYEADPARQGSGERVDLEGEATLSVVLDGVGYPFDTGVEEYGGPRRFPPGLPSVREVAVGGVFEGTFDAFVGVAQERPFRVFRLDGPQRVVVDVAHTG